MKYAAYSFLAMGFIALVSAGCVPSKARVNDPTELRAYVESANKQKAETGSGEGSLWVGNAYRSNLFRDAKARYINDVVTITSFEGKGSTSRATTLETNLSARVIDVLPNGYLVVEGMREIHLNNENQSIHLTGIVRPEDISSNNIVLSSSIAQMSVRVQGRGFVSQPIKPGWLYRILNGILPF
jgi:flagellar basal body L-ring protein FlgH